MFEKPCYPVFCKAHLSDIGKYHSLRCDSKQFEGRFLEFETLIEKSDVFFLGDLLPLPLIKGSQPNYIEGAEGIPVINTLSIQNLRINIEDCRYISEDDLIVLLRLENYKKMMSFLQWTVGLRLVSLFCLILMVHILLIAIFLFLETPKFPKKHGCIC